MDTIPANQNQKLEQVLRLFLLPDYNIASTTYFDDLLSHIDCTDCNATDKKILQRWVVEALGTWTTARKPCQAVITFTLKLIGIIGSNEFNFLYWYCEDILKKISVVCTLTEDDLQAPVKMAYVGMLMEFIKHRSGRQWIMEMESWKDVIRFCHSNHTLYVTRESQKFIWKLLQHESGNIEFCRKVILTAAEPLINNMFSPQVSPALEDNYVEQNELLLTIIDLLTVIMENTVFVSIDNTIPNLVVSVTNLESRMKGLFEACISTKFFARIMKLMYLIIFMKLKTGIKPPSDEVDPDILSNCFMNMRYIDLMLLSKKHILDMVKASQLILIYLKKMSSFCTLNMATNLKLEHQRTIIMVLPICSCMSPNELDEDVEVFVQKLLKISCTYTQRLCFMMKDILVTGEMPLENIGKISIQTAMDIIDVMDRDCTIIIFQIMSYVLECFTPSHRAKWQSEKSARLLDKENPRIQKFQRLFDGDPIVERPNLLAALLEGLATIIRTHQLKWQECLETINILSLSQSILSHPNVTPKLCVRALTLCKLAIQNFMAPNLALLVNCDGQTDDMGRVLFKRMHDPSWEVRDSVLEVISTIATISEDKYPAFQDLLLENKFPQLIIDVATLDEENYVRATALTCITIFVRIDRIWNEILCYLDLPKIALKLMTNESEAIVRREAVILTKELYVHRKWAKSTIEEMAKAMSVAAVSDLHWEVKVNALQFWDEFAKSHFSDQGMLDGTFPTVTFSKEHRKIVSLNDDEIRKRILKALDELAVHNCLGIFLVTLKDDSDLEVCKSAAEVLKTFKRIFLKYKVRETLRRKSLPPEVIDFNYFSKTDHNGESLSAIYNERTSTDENGLPIPTDIIELIVDSDDMNLLASVYEQTLNVNTHTEITDDNKLKYISHVEKNEFIRAVLEYDIDAYIEERSRWLQTDTNSFESVVDDILVAHKRKDVTELDCY